MEDMLSEICDDEVRSKAKRLAFLDMLLCAANSGDNMPVEDIQEEVDTFMFEVRPKQITYYTGLEIPSCM
jgi:hypothetical protein